MVFERIETLKREYTDKYVVVDGTRPELTRFQGQVGIVKTVNMSGRALVEFLDYVANIGWFDIDLDFLTVVPKPEAGTAAKEEKPAAKKAAPSGPAEKPAEKPVAKKPVATGEKKLSPIELARMQGAAKGGSATVKPKPATAAEAVKPTSEPTAGKKPSTAEILAAARTMKAAAAGQAIESPAAAAAPPTAAAAVAEVATPIVVQPAAVTERAPIAAGPAAQVPMKPAAKSPTAMAGPKPTTTAEKIAWCRQADAGRNAR